MALFVFFATAAVLSANLGTAQDTGLPQNCPRNPFSLHLQQGKVGLFQSPVWNVTSHCGQEWQRFGLCCNQTQLVEFAKADQASINRSVEAVLASLNDTLVNFNSSMDKALKITEDKFSQLDQKTLPIIRMFKRKIGSNFCNRLKTYLITTNLSSELRRCWSKISSARSSALCSVCSGRSNTFFNRERIMMLEADCSNILAECATSFRSTVDIVDLIAKYSVHIQQYIPKIWPKISKEFTDLEILAKKIESLDIQTLIKRFLSDTEKEKQGIAANLCSKFLNINGQTFIEKLDKVFHKLDFRQLERQMSEAQRNVSNFDSKGPQRVLSLSISQDLPQPQIPEIEPSKIFQNPSDIALLFEGDVVIVAKNTDSSYTSYYGAKGTTVSSHVEGQPFNITNLFP